MWLRDCTREEQIILSALVALAGQLSRPLHFYADALSDLNLKYFRPGGQNMPRQGGHNPSGRSLAQPHTPKAHERYGT